MQIKIHLKQQIQASIFKLYCSFLSPFEILNRFNACNNDILYFVQQACQLFMSVAVEQAGIDYHVVLAQNALQQCLDQPELQSEFICALVKQTSRHTQQRLGVQVKQAVRLVSLGSARVVSPAYCLANN